MNENRKPQRATNGSQGPGRMQRPGKQTTRAPKREGKSIRWMVIALLVAVAFMGWAVAAARYASDVDELQKPDMPVGRVGAATWFAEGLARFLWNSVVQLPNMHRVASHTATEHPLLLVIAVLFGVAVGLFGWWMSRLERQLAQEDKRFRH